MREEKKYFIRKDVATSNTDLFAEGIKNEKNTQNSYPNHNHFTSKSGSPNSLTSSNTSSITEDSISSSKKYKILTKDEDCLCSELEKDQVENYFASKQTKHKSALHGLQDKNISKFDPGKI